MDDILAVILFFVAVSITALFIRYLMKSHEAKVAAEAKRIEAEAEIKAAAARDRERLRASANEARKSLAQAHLEETFSVPRKKRTFVKREEAKATQPSVATHVPSPTQSVQSDDRFMDGMVTGMLVDNLINSITHKSGGSNPIDFPREERSVGVSKSESSWGFDDSDSRSSASSSFSSSSDSSSSWSSSDSSSSSVSSDW